MYVQTYVFLGYQNDLDKNIKIKYDVALVKFENSFEFDNYVNPICLPKRNQFPSMDLYKKRLKIIGNINYQFIFGGMKHGIISFFP